MFRDWFMVDVDDWPLADGTDLAADPDTAIRACIRDWLPPQLHDARCYWQMSAGCGLKPGLLKVHLFYWLAAPVPNARLKLVLQQHAPFLRDYSVYSAYQLLYV